MKKEAMSLKESREMYMVGFEGTKGRKEHCNHIITSKINSNILKIQFYQNKY